MVNLPGPFGPPHPDYVDGECFGFAWVGQSLAICDTCTRPFWEHRFDAALDKGTGEWVRRPVSEREAAAVKARHAIVEGGAPDA